MKLIISLLMIFGLFACADEDITDLKTFVETEKKNVYPINDKIPKLEQIEIVQFAQTKERNPFSTPRAEAVVAVKGAPKSCPQPDFNRKKQALEMLSLGNLKMRGTLQSDGELIALIQSPDGKVHQVKHGDYLGLSYGKVIKIKKNKVALSELSADKDGCWHKRETQITLLSK